MCAENVIRIDLVTESLNVSADGRAATFLPDAVASPFKSRSRLEAEKAALGHQLAVLQNKVRGRVHFTNNDRLSLAQLYRWFPSGLIFPMSQAIVTETWQTFLGGLPVTGRPRPCATMGEAMHQRPWRAPKMPTLLDVLGLRGRRGKAPEAAVL
jgi:hypothetical protein